MLNEVMNQIRFLPSAKQISEATTSEVRSAVADAFRKEGRTEARAPKQPAQLSQAAAASVKDLVTYYDMGHSVGDCSAWCKTCCKDGRSKVLIDEDRGHYPGARGVFATNQKLRNFKHNAKRQAALRGLHDTPADRFTFCATESKTVFESGEIKGNGGVQKGGRRKGEGGRRGGKRGGGPYV
jgi:hypothetical protein